MDIDQFLRFALVGAEIVSAGGFIITITSVVFRKGP